MIRICNFSYRFKYCHWNVIEIADAYGRAIDTKGFLKYWARETRL